MIFLSFVLFFVQLTTARLNELDDYVKKTPSNSEKSSSSLTAYLVKPTKNDEEKAYIIYSWIAHNVAYDVRSYRRGIRSNRNEDVLIKKIAVCEGYATLYYLMAKKAGLETQIVEGRARGSSDAKSFVGHAWNAVKINQKWKLLDATWGAGHLDRAEDVFQAEFSRYYFFTEPSRLIVSHLPDDTKWQLLEKPVSELAITNMIQGTPNYYSWNIKPLTHLSPEFKSDGLEVISLKVPNAVYVISELCDKNNKQYSETSTITIKKEDQVDIWVSLPKKGTYFLNIYGKKDANERSYSQLFTYKIEAQKSSKVTFAKTFETYIVKPFNLICPAPESLSHKDSVLFDMESSAFKKMVIVVNNEPNEMKKEGNRFYTKVLPKKGNVKIAGSVKGDTNYEILMQFDVK